MDRITNYWTFMGRLWDIMNVNLLMDNLGQLNHDLTSRPKPKRIMVRIRGIIWNHPQMAELLRLVKYDNLPRLMINDG